MNGEDILDYIAQYFNVPIDDIYIDINGDIWLGPNKQWCYRFHPTMAKFLTWLEAQ